MSDKSKVLLFLCVLYVSFSYGGFNDTPKYYKCFNKKGGSWEFGRAPNICDMDYFIDPLYVETEFSPYIFLDQNKNQGEKRRYMQETYSLVKDTALYFMKMRNANASEEEVKAFVHASYAIAHQESYWSHYRISSSNRLQMMRGDFGHGHGIFQVDDRWHFNAVKDGRAANIVMNMMYSLDEYYAAWKRAPSKSCVNGPNDFRNRSRAAYSAYNGGPSKICRFKNSGDRWARNDKGFLQKYDRRDWENYIEDFNQQAKVDIACIVDGHENCRAGTDLPPPSNNPKENIVYQNNNMSCLFKDDLFSCFENTFDLLCINSSIEIKTKGKVFLANWVSKYESKTLDRYSSCLLSKKVNSNIKLLKNINLRKTPGGARLTTAQKGLVYEVLDFQMRNNGKRYFRIKHSSFLGYVYAGDNNDHYRWSLPSSAKAKEQLLGNVGENIIITKSSGLKLKDNNGNDINTIPQDEIVQVKGFKIKEAYGHFFYQVEYQGDRGSIYAGKLLPAPTSKDYAVYTSKKKVVSFKKGKLINRIWYMRVRSCQSTSCSQTGFLKGPNISSETFEIQKDYDSGWSLIRQRGLKGYIRTKYISEIKK